MSRQTFTCAVVTGSGRGLGREFVLELVKRGTPVLATGRSPDHVAETVRLAREAGTAEVRSLTVDVADRAQVEAMAEATDALLDAHLSDSGGKNDAKSGGIVLLVNNAGVGIGGPEVGENTAWDVAIAVNLMGVVHGCEVFVPRMKARGHGHILNVASAAGLLCPPGMAPYNASKAAVIALSETMSAELAGSGVGVTALCPSFFPTELLKSDHVTTDAAELAALLMRLSPHSAADIARIGLDAAADRKQIAVPHLDTQALWHLKRLSPTLAGWVTRTATSPDNPLTATAVSLLHRVLPGSPEDPDQRGADPDPGND